MTSVMKLPLELIFRLVGEDAELRPFAVIQDARATYEIDARLRSYGDPVVRSFVITSDDGLDSHQLYSVRTRTIARRAAEAIESWHLQRSLRGFDPAADAAGLAVELSGTRESPTLHGVRQVVDEAQERGLPARKALAETYGFTLSAADRWLGEMRRIGWLEKRGPGRPKRTVT